MKKVLLFSFAGLLALSSCKEQGAVEKPAAKPLEPSQSLSVKVPDVLKNSIGSANARVAGRPTVAELIKQINSTVLANSPYKVDYIDIYDIADSAEVKTVQTLDQQFQSTLPYRWVPNDTRRAWSLRNGDLTDIEWTAFTPLAVANGTINAEPIYDAMYNKWENEGDCKTVNIVKVPYTLDKGNPSLLLNIGGLPAAEEPLADISVVGFLPSSVFNEVFEEPSIIAVALGFVFIDPATGEPTSTTRGKFDRSYCEVWFNDRFDYSVGAKPGKIDVESVVLHEFGHSLNLGHFGILQLFRNENGTGYVDYQPVNVMNAQYIGQPRNFLGPNDKGNFCESWGSWPFN